MQKRLLSCLLLMVTASPMLMAASIDTKLICKQMAGMVAPRADQPLGASRVALQHCNPEDLYYGFTQKADVVKARECAYLHAGKGQSNDVLAMIYANGQGVARNIDLAIHFACQGGFAPAEVAGRVEHLMALKGNPTLDTHFDMCDDITSGYMMGVCALHEKKLKSKTKVNDKKSFTADCDGACKQALTHLQKSADTFFAAHIKHEVDLSGTARAALQTEAMGDMQESFSALMKACEEGNIPHATASDWLAADQSLNTTYQHIQKNNHAKKLMQTTITVQGIKETQRAWIRYRDAWVDFGAIKCKKINADSWKTTLTNNRAAMLKEFE